MTQLETLAIEFCEHRTQKPSLAQAIARCSALTDLTLHTVSIRAWSAASWMRHFLPTLMRLQRLDIAWMPVDIECGAAASHLADTLEELIVDTPQPLSSLIHLRTLRRLRSLRLGVELSSGSGETIGVAEGDDETVSLPDLEQLTLTTRGECADGLDLGRFFGRLPALRRADLTRRDGVTSTQTRKMIKRMPDITSLRVDDHRLQSDELGPSLSSLLCLRELKLIYAGRDLAFLSSASLGHLGRTLERLTITSRNEAVPPLDLLQLHSLGALQSLNLNLRVHTGGHMPGVSCQPPAGSPSGLASLRELCVRLIDADKNIVHVVSEGEETSPRSRLSMDFGRLFGAMPHLRTASIACDQIAPATLADTLAHSTRLVELALRHDDLTAAHLTDVVRPLRRLRLLRVGSAAIDSLAFLTAPHLADTMQEVHLYPIGDAPLLPPASELHHLRVLTQLRSLLATLRLRPADDRDERVDVARDDDESRRHDLWPHMHRYVVIFDKKQGE